MKTIGFGDVKTAQRTARKGFGAPVCPHVG
jgi:hypothetical protein